MNRLPANNKTVQPDTPAVAGPFGPLWRNRALIGLLVWSEVKSTYARALLGLFWLILFPLFYVSIFVAVRVFLFDRSAGSPDWLGSVLGINDVMMIALMIFIGFIVFWQATEVLTRSITAVQRRSSYIEGSAFPVEALPWVTIGGAVFNLLFRFILFCVVFVVVAQTVHPTMLLFPVIIAPLLLMMIGLGFFLAALGPYLPDLEQVIAALTTGLLLLSAVIFPLSEVPDGYKPFVIYNPIAMTIEQARLVMVLGRMPDWTYLGWALGVGVVSAWAGFFMFRRLRRGFADVL